MATTNHERVGKAMDLLKQGLAPFVVRELESVYGDQASQWAQDWIAGDRINHGRPLADWDASALLKLMWECWNDVFRQILGQAERSLISELREHRNRWAHQEAFSTDDAYRVLDSTHRLLTAVSAPQVAEIDTMKMELLRLRFDEQARSERRKGAGTAIESAASGTLKPWREIVTPHPDVASGRYQQAEFAADLWQVHIGQGTDEYRDPEEFFRRTYLTGSLNAMLVGAVKRLSGTGGDPVVQLQTNFGGGKTHSMLALYHLFSGISPADLPGVDAVMAEAGIESLPAVRRVVLVGNRISPGNPATKEDGTVVRTLWGELAWQLGGKPAFARIAADDEKATSPGDELRKLLCDFGPCLILIDEWVAYARQLHDKDDLPGGSFDTQFTFAQALTETVKSAGNCLVVVSLPASDTSGSPHTRADDAEVGGERGRTSLERLRNVVGRLESSWRPATAEEGFEIVRRRLFEPLAGPESYKARDVVARAFADLYRGQHQEFPPECREADYEKRLRAAFPIHPEVFDRLYTDWSTLAKFQRTRGVLRLMAAVIHSLWQKGDRSPLILPASIPIDDPVVQSELTRYLSDNWAPVIEKDVDGPSALPPRIDSEVPGLGKFSACRRVARTIYLGSAPLTEAAHRGLEDRWVKLGSAMPGETPAVFGDALRRLSAAATYLYQDGNRYWYSTQPTVTKLAEDRAAQLLSNPDKVVQELEGRIRRNLEQKGDFSRIHPMPASGQDVPDDMDARLVVLRPEHSFSKDTDNSALAAAQAILESRGSSPRLFRNTLLFLAADNTRLQDLEEAVCKFLAWESILSERDELDLTPSQVKQAETQKAAADSAVTARLPETYQWLLAPVQASPQSPMEWQSIRLSGADALAVRASRKLKNDELLITGFAPTRLRMELDRVPLWRGDSVPVRQLAHDFAAYVYLPRLRDPSVLMGAIGNGCQLLTWEQDGFAWADGYDEAASRYQGLRAGQVFSATLDADSSGLLVRPEVARKQLDSEAPAPTPDRAPGSDAGGGSNDASGHTSGDGVTAGPARSAAPTRFHGSVVLHPDRVGLDAGKIAEEVIAHLSGILGASVTVTLEISADVPGGVPENALRTVTENTRTLKFTVSGFEKE